MLHLLLAVTYSSLVPLGEAPDESAHLGYARFIAGHGRLPATPAERQAADYRSDFPPLYYLLAAGPLAAVGDTPPTRLKSVGDTPRRLIPTNGQTIAAFIHIADEAWPWRGITLAWHLSRFISVGLMALALIPTYAIAWRLTHRRNIALAATALHAFIPQVLFIGSVLNEDGLLLLLSGLILLTLIAYTKPPRLPGHWHTLLLGMLLGLATVSKYNAIPLWPLVAAWGGWLARKKGGLRAVGLKNLTQHLAVLAGGVILTGGWWLGFVWVHFNEVDSLGLIRGSLAAFTASTHDTALRSVAAGASITLPPPAAWREWGVTTFKSFWGLFGGGGAIELPSWVYWVLAIFCLVAISPYILYQVSRIMHRASRLTYHPPPTKTSPEILLLLLTPFFFLLLPLLRFILTNGNIAETAQGRHLFPALPAISLGLVGGLASAKWQVASGMHHAAKGAQASRIPVLSETEGTHHVLRFTFYALRPEIILPTFAFLLSLYALPVIRSSYPPPIPLRTTADAATAENLLNAKLADSVTLIGYEPGQVNEGILPLTLVWRADAVPPEDYLIDLALTDPTGQSLGGWLGHPIGGRYPTRAWDEGDILRDTIPIPLIPGLPATEATLTLNLLNTSDQPTTTPLTLTTIFLPPAPPLPRSPASLRADGLPPDAPFTYRSTLSFALPNVSIAPDLIASNGDTLPPTRFLSGPTGTIVAHFIVEANWPSGDYQLKSEVQSKIQNLKSKIVNRPRQFEPPPMQQTVNANFAGQLTLLGYDLPQRRVQPGGSFPITLHWRAEGTIGQNLAVFNHLLDQDNVQRGGEDRIPLNYYTTLLWVPGEIVSDAYPVPVEAGAPPGVYWLDVGLYPTGQPHFPLPLFVNGRPIDRTGVRLGPLKVGGPPPGVTATDAHPQHPINKTFGPQGQITLLGFTLTDIDGNPIPTGHNVENSKTEIVNRKSKIVNLKLYWRANSIPAADYTVFVHLVDSDGNLAAQADSPPAGGAYPTSLWDPGEIIVDERRLSDLPPGRYTLQVGLYRPDTGERLPVAGVADGAVRLMEFEIAPSK